MDPLINPRALLPRSFGAYDPYTAGPIYSQNGEGFFSFLNVFRKLVPLFKAGIKAIMPVAKSVAGNSTVKKIAGTLRDQAVEAGLNVAVNSLKGGNVKAGLKRDLSNTRTVVAENLEEFRPNKKKKKSKPSGSRRARANKKKRARDLFT